ncbi:MAG: DinB family protein [Bacteroidetes bacterium]|nr:MAG: DinB family protein [Bacteroidota bacterium]
MNFDFTLSVTRQTRRNMEGILDAFSLEQLNAIPDGFRNNLIWNYGHAIITQQLLCYGLAGLPTKVAPQLVSQYRKGAAPDLDAPVSQSEYESLRELAVTCLDQFAADHAAGLFDEVSYKAYTTSYGATLTSVAEAFHFNVVHEGLHFGTMLAMRKLL